MNVVASAVSVVASAVSVVVSDVCARERGCGRNQLKGQYSVLMKLSQCQRVSSRTWTASVACALAPRPGGAHQRAQALPALSSTECGEFNGLPSLIFPSSLSHSLSRLWDLELRLRLELQLQLQLIVPR